MQFTKPVTEPLVACYGSTMTPTIRLERVSDIPTIAAINRSAFPTDGEARLVEALRAGGNLAISLVAETDTGIVGHIAFSPVTVDSHSLGGLGLAPVAVMPAWQRRGVGTALIRTGLEACRAANVPFVVVLGHPDYYARFGFTQADTLGLANEYGVGPEFMVQSLVENGLPQPGLVRYANEFANLA